MMPVLENHEPLNGRILFLYSREQTKSRILIFSHLPLSAFSRASQLFTACAHVISLASLITSFILGPERVAPKTVTSVNTATCTRMESIRKCGPIWFNLPKRKSDRKHYHIKTYSLILHDRRRSKTSAAKGKGSRRLASPRFQPNINYWRWIW